MCLKSDCGVGNVADFIPTCRTSVPNSVLAFWRVNSESLIGVFVHDETFEVRSLRRTIFSALVAIPLFRVWHDRGAIAHGTEVVKL